MPPLASSSTPLVASAPLSPGLSRMFGARSGCVSATPVSMIPTLTAASPVVRSHASSASMSASAVPVLPRMALAGVAHPPEQARELVVGERERPAWRVGLGVQDLVRALEALGHLGGAHARVGVHHLQASQRKALLEGRARVAARGGALGGGRVALEANEHRLLRDAVVWASAWPAAAAATSSAATSTAGEQAGGPGDRPGPEPPEGRTATDAQAFRSVSAATRPRLSARLQARRMRDGEAVRSALLQRPARAGARVGARVEAHAGHDHVHVVARRRRS